MRANGQQGAYIIKAYNLKKNITNQTMGSEK